MIAAARFLGVPPWDLARQPVFWVDVAHQTMVAEEHAREMHKT